MANADVAGMTSGFTQNRRCTHPGEDRNWKVARVGVWQRFGTKWAIW
jgi:hypothetical protein